MSAPKITMQRSICWLALGLLACDSGSSGDAVHAATAGSSSKSTGSGSTAGQAAKPGANQAGNGALSRDAGGSHDNTDKAHGVGKLCEGDGDCPAPLYCRQDPQSFVAHKQCVADCSSEAECSSRFGEYATCIGAKVCVTKCSVMADCPLKTECNANGWCIRSGAGSGVPMCVGTARSCAVLSETECSLALGCTSSYGSCSGVAPSCSGQFSSGTCSSISGCYWSSTTMSCAGSTSSCSVHSSATCNTSQGCHWTAPLCSGAPLSCSQLSTSLCTTQPGCSLTTL